MATFNGNFHYTGTKGNQQQGPCRIEFDKETFTISSGAGPALSFDLGDIDGIVGERHQLRLRLYTGAVLLLDQLGSSYDNLVRELTAAHREREVQCLLLADMPEIARFYGHFERTTTGTHCPSCGAAGVSGKFCRHCGTPLPSQSESSSIESCPSCGTPGQTGHFCRECGHALSSDTVAPPSSGEAEIRLYKSNIAILPERSSGFQLRLEDVKHVRHDASSYDVWVDLENESLKCSALGKRTAEFAEKLNQTWSELQAVSAQALHLAFPFLNPDQLQQVVTLLPEGSSARVQKLKAIDARIEPALVANAVDKDLAPYYQELLARSDGAAVYAGLKLIRPEDEVAGAAVESNSDPEGCSQAPDADHNGPDVLYWFFFPIASGGDRTPNVVAWEASSRGGRATYFFRLASSGGGSLDKSIWQLNRGLAALNFRRRPIYLSDIQLSMNPLFRRYAIAARRIPELRAVRASFLGRAIHGTIEGWKEQVAEILNTA